MANFFRIGGTVVCLASLLALGSCGGGGDGTSMFGAVNVSVTDAPVDGAAEVVVVFTGVDLHGTDGKTSSIDFSAPKTVDLLKLQNGVTGVLTDGASVPAGSYDWMRLKVLADKNTQGQSYIKLLDGTQYPLWIPSGAETGLKLVRPFTVAQGSVTRLIVDFDLRKSITAPPGQDPNYIMRPTLRLMDQLQVGKIVATVNLATLASAQLGSGAPLTSCKAGLYLFSGANAVPDDQDGSDTNGASPIVYQPIPYDGVNAQVPITIGFVEVGTYTLAATCDFAVDAADTDDYDPAATQGMPGYHTMHWTTVGNVSLTANGTATVSIP